MFAQLQLQHGKRGIRYSPASHTCGDGARGTEREAAVPFGDAHHSPKPHRADLQVSHAQTWPAAAGTHTLLSVIDMESSVRASLEISLSLALVAGAKT